MRRLLVLGMLVLSTAVYAQRVGEQRVIALREAQLRSAPNFLSPIATRLPYGTEVELLEVRPGWFRVADPVSGEEGWLTSQSVETPQALNLAAGSGDRGETTTREIALAGRGFNEQIESEFKEDTDLDFTPVDTMEQFVLPTSELAEFLQEVDADLTLGGSE